MDKFKALRIFQSEQFSKLQDDLALATGLALITVDYRGVPITQHSRCTDLCKFFRKSVKFRKLCERCDSHGGLEAARMHAPYIYLCHAGLVDFAVPIVYNDQYLGAALGGQVLLSDENDKSKLEQIYKNPDINAYDGIKNLEVYHSIPVMSLERIKANANILFMICNFLLKTLEKENEIHKYYAQKVESKDRFDDKDSYSNVVIAEQTSIKNPILEPSFIYIKNNLDKDLSLAKVASVCNISPSYFSRLFSKEKLGTYAEYINRLKIEQAKNLLVCTDMSIKEISSSLNYKDCSYFIKVFKTFTQTTQLKYKKNHHK